MYEVIEVFGVQSIKRTDDDGTIWFIPFENENSDFQKYLIDTDGGLSVQEVIE